MEGPTRMKEGSVLLVVRGKERFKFRRLVGGIRKIPTLIFTEGSIKDQNQDERCGAPGRQTELWRCVD
jgi:hypothetical protein